MGENKCWLVGRNPDTGELSIVEGVRIGEPRDGEQVVNIRPNCRHKFLVTVQAERVFSTEDEAEARIKKGWWGEEPD